MKITVNKDNVKIEEFDIVHEGEHRVNKCSFSFSEEYTEELVKKAIFTSQNSSVEVAIINNECNIPTEILKARNIVLLGVYAYKVVDDKLDLRYSPSPDAFKVNSGSYIEGANESEEITPSQFEQYMQALNDGLNKVEESIKKMDEATSSATQLVDKIEQKLENGEFIGPEGPQGVPGTNGKDGVGITTVTSGQATQQDGNTVTPVIVNKTDGTQQTFNVSAKNGTNGIDGSDGTDGVTPNLQIGTVTTLEPNQNATVTRTGTDEEPVFNFGIPKGQKGEQGIPGQDGQPGADGQPGQDGADGKDATINGQNTVEITTDNNITLDQQESVLKLGLNSQLIPKNNAEGTDNTFDDGLKSPLFALAGDGKSEQETTTGKNKFDTSSLRNRTQTIGASTGNIYTLKPNTQYTVSTNMVTSSSDDSTAIIGTPQSANAFIFVSSDTTIEIISSNTHGVGTINNISRTLMTDDTGNIFVGIRESASSSLSDLISKGGYVQIEEGSQATSYEPYTGGQPSPSPDYPQEKNSIEGSLEFACRGKSLLNATKEEYTANGLTVSFDNSNMYINGIANQNNKYIGTPYKLGKGTYTLSLNILRGNIASSNTGAIFYLYEGTSYTTLNKSIILKTNTKGYSTFTLEKETNVNLGLFARTTETFNNVVLQYQVTKGENPDYNFEPYVEPNKVTFNLNDKKLRSVGDVKDELVVDLDTGDYYKVENVGEVVFDGSDDENFRLYSPENTIMGFTIPLFTSNPIKQYLQSNYFRCKNTYYTWQGYGYFGVNNTGTIWFQTDNDFSSVEEFKQWLSENNVYVDYQLTTPTTKKLGTLSSEDLAKLSTFDGYNNLFINTNLGLMNIRFTYGLDIKKYVDNKIAELSAQMIEEG